MPRTPVPSPQVAEQLERMLQSSVFRGAARSSTLLRFLVEQTLAGHADRLKDYTLGAEALGRGDDFDPRTDPIARVEASRLRSRLELYYATEGSTDPVAITLPKGGYVPVFELRGAVPAPVRTSPRLLWNKRSRLGAALAIVGVGTALLFVLFEPAAERTSPGEMRFEISTPLTTDPISMALAPDAQQVVVVGSAGAAPRLWIRPLNSTAFTPLPGTDHASLPFWSPDGGSIGFFADTWIKRLDLGTGLVQNIARVPVPAGAAWNSDGVILFPRVPDGSIFRVAAGGGTPEQVTRLAPRQTGHRAPRFLPDGRQFLYFVAGSPEVRGVYVGDLAGGSSRRLMDADAPAVHAAGHLFYVQQGTLFARAFDPADLSLDGRPLAVADQIAVSEQPGVAALTASDDGLIAFRPGRSGGKRQLVWFDRQGRELASVGIAESRGPLYPSLSPDGRRLAVQRTTDGNTDIWLLDLERNGTSERLTTEPQADIAPVWSPSGDRLVYTSQDEGVQNLFLRRVTGGRERLVKTSHAKQATDWSRDGRFLLFRSVTPDDGLDLWAVPLEGDRTPREIARTKFDERDAQFSPDGRWIAFQSNDSGRSEIYVQPFPGPGERRAISARGGAHVRWRADGQELFYITLSGELVAVPVTVSSRGAIELGTEQPLFAARVGNVLDIALPHYVVSRDGQRVLLDTVVEEAAAPISVILNWQPRGVSELLSLERPEG